MFSFMKSLHFHLSQVGRQESADNKEPITDRKYANAGPSIKSGTWNIPEHSGTSRNIPEDPGTCKNKNNFHEKKI